MDMSGPGVDPAAVTPLTTFYLPDNASPIRTVFSLPVKYDVKYFQTSLFERKHIEKFP